jgi:type I restriction enzyme S subunit
VKEDRRAGPYLAYQLLKGMDFGVFNAGSAVPTLDRNHVHSLPVALPPPRLARTFEATAEPMHPEAFGNERQNRTLCDLCDTLLPKLLTGEICLKDGERLVENLT